MHTPNTPKCQLKWDTFYEKQFKLEINLLYTKQD